MALITVNEGGGGDFLPIVQYDARSGRIFRTDKDNGITEKVDITRMFKALFDFEQVEVGWIMFAAGTAPDFKMAPYGQQMPPRPPGEYKQGIRMRVKLAPSIGGDVRELASTAGAFLRGINIAHDAYLAAASTNPGKLPVLTLEDATPVESGGGTKKSTNYQPVFAIAGWAPRPADMPLTAGGAAANGNGAHAPAPAPTRAPLPAPPPAQSTNDRNRASNEDDFGD